MTDSQLADLMVLLQFQFLMLLAFLGSFGLFFYFFLKYQLRDFYELLFSIELLPEGAGENPQNRTANLEDSHDAKIEK